MKQLVLYFVYVNFSDSGEGKLGRGELPRNITPVGGEGDIGQYFVVGKGRETKLTKMLKSRVHHTLGRGGIGEGCFPET